TAGELARALEELLAVKSPAPRARSRVAVVAAVVVLAGLAAVLGFALHAPATKPPPATPAPTRPADTPRPATAPLKLDLWKELKLIRKGKLVEVSPALEEVLFGQGPIPPQWKPSLVQPATDGFRNGLAFLKAGPRDGPPREDPS